METVELILHIVGICNTTVGILFFVFFSYQLFFVLVPILIKKPKHENKPLRNYGIIISARNEELVIGNLIESLKKQTYDKDHLSIFVVADNCTDKTAEVARTAGAIVYERFDNNHIGKGYAIDYLYDRICEEYGDTHFDAYAVFDADNIVDPHYFEEINKVFSEKYPVVTSLRNSKNYGDNWISSGYALWFLRESQFLNRSRMRCKTTCAVSGTGFVFDSAIMREVGGWKFFLLTEDIEFTIFNVLKGRKIGYAEDAIIYDEQPTKFSQSFRQRMRWSKGYIQVMGKYGIDLVKGVFSKKSFSCFDMSCTVLPTIVLAFISIITNVVGGGALIIARSSLLPMLTGLINAICGSYVFFTVLGGITIASEWKKIHSSPIKKILSAFSFPLFMITYVPITIAALFSKIDWKPIEHNKPKTLDDILADGGKK